MSWELSTNKNYTYFTNTVDDNQSIRYPGKDILYRESSNAIDIIFKFDRATMIQMQKSDISSPVFADNAALISWLDTNTGGGSSSSSVSVNTSKNALGYDAWGRAKVVNDISLFHGMFTYNVPVLNWYETVNDIIVPFTNCTSENGELHVRSGGTLFDNTYLRSFRSPRYEPNKGALYSTACILPNPSAVAVRRWGTFTKEAGVFFELETGVLSAVVRTTYNSVTTDDKYVIDTTGIDLSKGHVYDIQYQWRGVGNYKFFINLEEKINTGYLGTLTKLSMFNPALPVAFESGNAGNVEVDIIVGCVDVTSEGGINNGKTYGSVGINNETGQVAVTGFNTPVIAIRSKVTVAGLINTRDTLALLASAYSDQRSMFRVWATRDFTAITENDQTWVDFGDGHLEYMQYDNPNVGSPMTFDTAKAELVFGSRVNIDETYSTSALFEGRTEIYLTPGDMFTFTVHRETGQACNVGVSFEFAEAI